MKTLALILSLATLAHAEMREWTDAATSRTLTAKLIEKNKDGDTVKVSSDKAKTLTLTIAKLSKEDQDYIAGWKPFPLGFDYLKCTFAGSPRKGRKLVSVRVMTHDKPCVVTFWEYPEDTRPSKREIPAYSDETWNQEGNNNYKVQVTDEDGNVLDTETATSKTDT